MNPVTLMPAILSLAALLACIVGFLSCAVIVAEVRHDPMMIGNHRGQRLALYRWIGAFFFGCGLIVVDCAMGDRGPVPIAASYGGTFGLGSVLAIWIVICGAGLTATKAVAYCSLRRAATSRRWLPAMSNVLFVALASVACLAGTGGCASNAAFVTAMDQTQRAVGPEYLRYVQDDLNLNTEQRTRRQRTVALWRAAIDEAQTAQNGVLDAAVGNTAAPGSPAVPGPVPTTQPAR